MAFVTRKGTFKFVKMPFGHKNAPGVFTRSVMELVFADNLKFGGLKCEFLLERVEVLGHIVEDGKLYAKVDKL